MQSGHYYIYIRDLDDANINNLNLIYCFNDSNVTCYPNETYSKYI